MTATSGWKLVTLFLDLPSLPHLYLGCWEQRWFVWTVKLASYAFDVLSWSKGFCVCGKVQIYSEILRTSSPKNGRWKKNIAGEHLGASWMPSFQNGIGPEIELCPQVHHSPWERHGNSPKMWKDFIVWSSLICRGCFFQHFLIETAERRSLFLRCGDRAGQGATHQAGPNWLDNVQ